jgi:O-antigen/teichoic acid export membrane protein
MTSSQRILTNTAAQYIRTIINVCLSLYSTRLILAALGQTDYGIYSVVAGVVAMLSFMTNALVSTTQRYLSFNHGTGDKAKIYHVFGNSLLLHIALSLGLLVILGLLTRPIIYGVLNIESGREFAAVVVYLSATLMLMLSFITAPFRALFIARENIVYISIIDVLDGVLKLLIAIFLLHVSSYDTLITYSVLLIGIGLFNLLAFAVYALRHFEECHLPRWHEWDKQFIFDLSSFAGWTIYSTGCIIARTQGIAIILNRIFGSVINAAYGIAQQVTGAINFVAQSVLNAMSPQIVKAEGSNERERMIRLSELASKYATLLMAIIVIPLVFEMPQILRFWLQDIPDNTVMFCRFVLLAAVCDQMTIGLGIANQAIGKIRNYSLVINTIKVLTLPAAWLCLHMGLPVVSTMYCYLLAEIICALARLPFLKVTAGLFIKSFVLNVFVRILPTLVAVTACSYAIIKFIDMPYRFLITILVGVLVGSITTFLLSMSDAERRTALNMLCFKKC